MSYSGPQSTEIEALLQLAQQGLPQAVASLFASHRGEVGGGGNPAMSMGYSNRLAGTLSQIGNSGEMGGNGPGTLGRNGGGGGRASAGFMGPRDNAGSRMADSANRDYERGQRRKDALQEGDLANHMLQQRLNLVRGLFGDMFNRKLTSTREEAMRQAGDIVKVPLKSTEQRDYTSEILRMIGG